MQKHLDKLKAVYIYHIPPFWGMAMLYGEITSNIQSLGKVCPK